MITPSECNDCTPLIEPTACFDETDCLNTDICWQDVCIEAMQDLLLLPTGVKRALKKTRQSTTTRTGSYDDDNNIDWVPGDIIDEGGNMQWWHKLLISLAVGILISACISLCVKYYA